MDYKKSINKSLKKVNNRYILQICIFDLIVLFVAILGILSVDIFLVGSFAIILPAYFSTFLCCAAILVKRDITNKEFFTGFINYFNRRGFFYGVFNAIMGLLKACLFGFLANLIFTYIYTAVLGDSFYDVLQQIVDATNDNDINLVYDLLESNEILNEYSNLSSLISLGIGSYIMILHVGKYSLGIACRASTGTLGPRVSNYVFKSVYRNNRKEIVSDIFKNLWWCMLGILLFLAAGITIPYILGLEATYCYLIGIFVSIFFASFCMPYFFAFSDAFMSKYDKEFSTQFVKYIDDLVNSLNTASEINKEEKESYEKLLKKYKDDLINESDEEDPEDKDE